MLQFFRSIKGYVAIKIWGLSAERFMNLCGNHNIFLWNIVNHGDYYTMCISLKGFYRLRPIARKTGTRVVITQRYGLPFFSAGMKKRKIFLAGIIFCLLFLIRMGSFLWRVELTGNFYVTEDVFTDFLAENGIRPGMKKKQVNIEELEKAIRNEYDIILWTSARIEGTRLIIQVKENEVYQPKAEGEEAENTEVLQEGYDLVAHKEGTVVSIITRAGVPLVTEGTPVKKGDILVEGCIPIYNEDATLRRYEYCRADADILIETIHSETAKLPERYTKRRYTGAEKSRPFLVIGERRLRLPYLSGRYEEWDAITEQSQLLLFDGLELPVYYGKETVREYVKEETVYTKEEIKAGFEEKILKLIQTLEEKGVQIIEKNVTIKKYKGTWSMKVDFLVKEKAKTLQKSRQQPKEEPSQTE